ncbi:cytochrome c(L), periplasmic [Methylobacillus flagellatus]|uniref:cytochrome c(L), periplasmic n=1 Tax=Methylobacillus flagellatus TaxID=405 RepID=UPI0010F9A449|nr:cytochrome c(L), periplasmic [Methylobacillus flagellatus]
MIHNDTTPGAYPLTRSAVLLGIALVLASISQAQAAEEAAGPVLDFRGTISGEPLDFNDGKGPDTPAVQKFMRTGKNPYNDQPDAINNGNIIFSTACAGCHGHHAEGKLGPALGDDYWTYPGNALDKGLFETIYGGGQGMMGPQRGLISRDEILQVMGWLRSIYHGDPKKAKWKK